MPTKLFRHGKAFEKLSDLMVKAPEPSHAQRPRKSASEKGTAASPEDEKGLVDVVLDLSVAEGLLKDKERTWRTLSAAKSNTSKIEKEVAALKAGIESSKRERDVLIEKVLRKRSQP